MRNQAVYLVAVFVSTICLIYLDEELLGRIFTMLQRAYQSVGMSVNV